MTQNLGIQSRNKACELIKANKVQINGKIISKPSFIVEKLHDIKILEEKFYVSRAAYKLKYFLDKFAIVIENKEILDIGSSTGGFTQIVLEYGAKSVTCVDVGDNQLHPTLRGNPKIEFFENCDIREFKPDKVYEFVTCDVSFISVCNILEAINTLAKSEIILLFKPQFEVGANTKRDSKGVVQDLSAIEKAKERFLEECKKLRWDLIYNGKSELSGKEGNIEEFFYFKKEVLV